MFTDFTWSDWQDETNKIGFIPQIIDRYKSSKDFQVGLDANAYFCGENTTIMQKVLMQPDVVKVKTEDGTKKNLTSKAVIGNRCSSDFLFRFIVQQNQFLLGNGVNLKDDELKKKLGIGFDTRLQECGEDALKHGVAWGYWNNDHIEVMASVKDAYSGFVALLDEMTSVPMVGIQFWQIASNKPMGVRLFEQDGVTVLRYRGTGEDGSVMPEIVEKKRAYKFKVATDGVGKQVIDESNYAMLPVLPLYANPEHRSEFTPNIRSKIDAYDRIASDFCDNLDRANDVYWVLNNFGGGTDDVIEMIDTINKVKAVINQSNATGGGATAEPKTIEVPYAARQTALDILRKSLYQDYMALDMDEIHGGSLTNVAIQTATANMNLKADRYEWQCFNFVQNLLKLIGVKGEDLENIRFNRRSVTNDTETISNIYTMRDDVSREWALKANPMVNPDEIEEIMKQRDAEEEKDAEKERKRQEEQKAQQAPVQQTNTEQVEQEEKGDNESGEASQGEKPVEE